MTPDPTEWLTALETVAKGYKRAAEAYRTAVTQRMLATYLASEQGASVADMARILEIDRHNVHRLIHKGRALAAGNPSPLRPATESEKK